MKLDRTGKTGPAADMGLWALYLIAAASIAGFGVFRAWPHLLASPTAMAFYPRAFELFPRVQIALAFVVLALVLWRNTGWRWVPAFIAVYAASLGSELLGTTVGVPFGPYEYTALLGPKWFSHVPLLIPVSWFTMALPSYALCARIASRGTRVVVASLLLLAWDLALDPAMSGATTYWIWGSKGAYYGMPLTNLLGWFVTGLALMAVFAAFGAEQWIDRLPRRWLAAYYGANLALPVGMALAAGMWFAVAVTFASLLLCAALTRASRPALSSRVLVGAR